MIDCSHALRHSDWLIAGAKPKPGEPLPAEQELNRSFFDSVQPLLVQAGVRRGGAIMFNRWAQSHTTKLNIYC